MLSRKISALGKLHSAVLAVLCLFTGILLAMTPAHARETRGAASRAAPIQTPFYACFNAAIALRIGDEVVYNKKGEGKVRHWVEQRFKSGECLALPIGTRIERTKRDVVSGHHVQRFQVAGSTQWLVRPDWAMRQDPGGGMTETTRAFLAMVPITKTLMGYAALHIACLIEIKDLNRRVIAHNTEVTEERDAEKDGITRTVIIMNPSDLDARGGRLGREVEDFRRRCTPYRTLEASTPFVRMVRELGGLDPDLAKSRAA